MFTIPSVARSLRHAKYLGYKNKVFTLFVWFFVLIKSARFGCVNRSSCSLLPIVRNGHLVDNITAIVFIFTFLIVFRFAPPLGCNHYWDGAH